MGPLIPPDRAFAVEGQVRAAVRATLAEARRLRDGWSEALEAERAALRERARDRLAQRLRALERWGQREAQRLERQALATARSLALKILREGDLPARVAALPLDLALELHCAPEEAERFAALDLPESVELVPRPGLAPGDLILVTRHGRLDLRQAARLPLEPA